jgi:hypothetical protein
MRITKNKNPQSEYQEVSDQNCIGEHKRSKNFIAKSLPFLIIDNNKCQQQELEGCDEADNVH